MKRVLVENIEDGMVLDRDICGPSGNILLGKGTVLSVAIGRRLKNWNISQVQIEGEEEGKKSTDSALASPAEIKSQMENIFSNCLNNPIMKNIYAAVYQFRIQNND